MQTHTCSVRAPHNTPHLFWQSDTRTHTLYAYSHTPTSLWQEEVWAAVESLIPAIEIAASRCPKALPASPDTSSACIADFALNGVLVLGIEVPASTVKTASLSDSSAVITRRSAEGNVTAQGKGTNVMGSPLTSLCWLANSLSKDGCALCYVVCNVMCTASLHAFGDAMYTHMHMHRIHQAKMGARYVMFCVM